MKSYADIPGLYVIPNFITHTEEAFILTQINNYKWSGNGVDPNSELKRRTQMHGYEFSYRHRVITKYLGDLPSFIHPILQRIHVHFNHTINPAFDMLLINEYLRGQGIMPHNDAPSIFGAFIGSLSLVSDCIMQFTCIDDSTRVIDIVLPRRSFLLMSGVCRYKWKHGISKEPVDIVKYPPTECPEQMGMVVERDTRISLTLRSVLPESLTHLKQATRSTEVM